MEGEPTSTEDPAQQVKETQPIPVPEVHPSTTVSSSKDSSTPPAESQEVMKRRVFVGNLPHECSEEELRLALSKCGEIETTNIVRDRETSTTKGYGFVTFSHEEGANACLKQESFKFQGRDLNFGPAKRRNRPRSQSAPRRYQHRSRNGSVGAYDAVNGQVYMQPGMPPVYMDQAYYGNEDDVSFTGYPPMYNMGPFLGSSPQPSYVMAPGSVPFSPQLFYPMIRPAYPYVVSTSWSQQDQFRRGQSDPQHHYTPQPPQQHFEMQGQPQLQAPPQGDRRSSSSQNGHTSTEQNGHINGLETGMNGLAINHESSETHKEAAPSLEGH